MSLISLQGASFDYGRETILNRVNLSILAGVKYALVGANGVGKSSLLAMLAGELPVHEGARQQSGSLATRTLYQETTLDPEWDDERSLHDSVMHAAFAEELALEAEMAELADQLTRAAPDDQPELVQRQGRLQSEFERRSGYTLRPRLQEALAGVGLGQRLWERPLLGLSGGERRRAALAAILLAGGDLLLLDEPTNHLDLMGLEWLEGYLTRFDGAAVLVSHDRQFLDRVVTQTLHLRAGKLTTYSGNYSFFEKAHRRQRQQQLVAYERQQEQIRRTEDYIQRNIAGQKTRQAQSRRLRLAKLERLDRPPPRQASISLTFAPERPSGQTVLDARGITKGYGERTVIRDCNLLVGRGERLGIIGPNGCGKTTLLKILAGKENADLGTVSLGHNVDLGLYDQHLETVSDNNSVIEELAVVEPAATIGQLRGALGAFGFGDDLVDRPVGKLSGGERGRLALLCLVKRGFNTLLLDEPTNHLDIRSREALENALMDYAGTLILVSHDRRFLDRLIDRLLIFSPERPSGEIELFQGNYAEYCRRRDDEAAKTAASRTRPAQPAAVAGGASGPGRSAADGLSKNERERRRRWIGEIEKEIAALESEREELLAEMTAGQATAGQRRDQAERCAQIEQILSEKLRQWEAWNIELE